MNQATQKIEALLFVAGEAVPKMELAELLASDAAAVDVALRELAQDLQGHGLALLMTTSHAQLVTAPAVKDYLTLFYQGAAQAALSKAAAEVLALVAYRGPIARYDIDVIRGVDGRQTLRTLVQRGLVRKISHDGQTPLYDITEEFWQHAGVTSREELPNFANLSQTAAITDLLARQGKE